MKMKPEKLIHLFFMSVIVSMMGACVPKATETKAVCGVNQAFSKISRSCYSIVAGNKAALASNITPASFLEDTQSIITLSYTDVDIDLATNCQLTNLTNVTITQACSCDVVGVCTVGVTGTSNYFGAAQFSYAVKTNNVVSNNATANLTITSVNDGPTISAIAAQSTNEDVTKVISFTVDDVDTTLSCAGSVSVTANTDPVLVPSVVITGTIPNCIATIAPAANLSGASNITLQVTDGTLLATSAFLLTVNAVNDSPTFSFLSNVTIDEDDIATANFTLDDVDSVLDCTAAYLSGSTSNTLLVPSIDITFSGVYPNCVVTMTPLLDQNGTTNITLTASDGVASASSNAFTLTVTPVNDAPVISAIVDQITDEDLVAPVSYTILDVDNTLTCAGSVSVTGNTNPTLIGSIVMSGTAPACTATITPAANQSGESDLIFTVTDGSLTSTSAFKLTVNYIDDPPYFNSTIVKADTNEGGMVVAGPFKIDEDEGSTADEDFQAISVSSITSDNTSVLPDASNPNATSAIRIFYDLNDNGVEDAGEERDLNATLENAAADDAHTHSFYLKLYPVAGVSGNANITLTATDGLTPITSTFSLIVHPIAALHGGWANISAKGIKTDKSGAPAAEADVQCNYNKSTDTNGCDTNQSCTGTNSPSAVVLPDAANVLYWDSANKKCYRSTGTSIYSWVEFKTTCPLIRNSSCTGGNCISVVAPIPSAVGQYYYNTGSGCYISTGTTANTDWISYTPSKITLTWNTFTVSGSGAESAVTVYGWNVYRREAGHDYDFQSGFLKVNSTDTMTISDSTVRTFTDTTAVAGKVYYYLVRPVDSTTRHLSISTPEVYSEVRSLAPVENYAFVHRWMVNQEVCNSMHMTTSTANRVDPTHNYRCPYIGPGESSGYYDIGKDMLVDISENGCPYTAAPTCTSNGCVGIGDPTTLGVTGMAANNIYYDRSAGSCYIYNGAAWLSYNAAGGALIAAASAKVNTALNAPLVNLVQSQAALVCTNRSSAAATAALTGVTPPPAAMSLPSKKEYIAYSAAPYGTSDSTLTDMEQGFSLNVQSRCNSSSANGIDTAFSDSSIPSTSYIFSLPGTSSSSIRSIYTGSVPWGINFSTETCSSRYGVQDVYGNIAEWVKDSMTCDTNTNTCAADAGTDLGDYDFDTSAGLGVNYGFDLITGPYNDVNADSATGSGDALLTEWIFRDELFGAGKFNFPMGMPMNVDIGTGTSPISGSTAIPFLLDIGPTAGITSGQLHEDGIVVNGALTTLISFAQATTIETDAIQVKNRANTHYTNTSALVAYAEDTADYDSYPTGTVEHDAYLAAVSADNAALAAYNAAFSAASASSISKNAISTSPFDVATSDLVASTKALITTANTLVGTARTYAVTAQTKAYLTADAVLQADSDTAKTSGDALLADSATSLASANVVVSGVGGLAVGGSYLSGNLAGRYTSELIPATVTREDVGFRCYIPVDKDNYPADVGRHIYSY